AACLAALAPAGDDRGDVEEVAQREVERRDQNARTAFADDRAVRIDVERRETLRDRALFARRARGVYRFELGARHQCAGTEGIQNLPARPRRGIRGAPQRDLRALKAG